jgi:acyl carrier protein
MRHPLTEARVARIFADVLKVDVPSADTDLFEAGVLDSLAFVELLLQIEERFGIRTDSDDLEADHFSSIARIAQFVDARTGRAPAGLRRVVSVAVVLGALTGLIATPATAGAQGLGGLVVTVTEPASGATVTGTTDVRATVTVVGGLTVRGVQFQLDGVNLGSEDVTAPYSMVWNTVPVTNGPHTLTAVARDILGLRHTSAPANVTVFNDTTAPAVSITSPAGGATVAGAVTVTATASDNVGVAGVQFFLDGAALGAEDTAAPYAASWNTVATANGSHALTARARDAAGNVKNAAAVTVTVRNDAAPPEIRITAPAEGAVLNGIVVIAADAADDIGVIGVQFLVDGAALGAEDTSHPYSATWDTAASAGGSHTLTARARDASGKSTLAAAVRVTVAAETTTRLEETAAAIAYAGGWSHGNTARPWSGGSASLGTVAGARATLSFSGTAAGWISMRGPQMGIAHVFVDGAHVSTVDAYAAAEQIGAVLFTASGLSNGPHTLAIEATGTRNPAASEIYVVVDAFDVTASGADTINPTVSVTGPAAGTSVSGTIAITADASDAGGIAGVRFLVDGTQIGPEDTAAPYAATWDTTRVADGTHMITAVARDVAGNTATSAAIGVTVSNTSGPSTESARRYENTDLSIVYSPGTTAPGQPPDWWIGGRSRTWSGGTASFNRSAGARASLIFTGTGVRWIGFRAPWAGIANVYLDGVFAAEIDLYTTVEQVESAVYSVAGLPAGTHRIDVESTGRKNAAAEDYVVVLDAFDVTPSSASSVQGHRADDTSPSVTFAGAWARGDTTRPWSGQTASIATGAGATATFTFVGTSIDWIGLRGPDAGIARIYLDGTFHAEVDAFAATAIQTVLFSARNLAAAAHTLVIEATGLKRAAATDSRVVVDAFDVRTRLEESAAAVAFSGPWTHGHTAKNWSGTSAFAGTGTASVSASAGASATITFDGTSVAWIGYRGPVAGIARVFVDGQPMGEVDTYAAAELLQAVVFEVTGLPAGRHTLRVEVTGLRNPAATGGSIVVDAVEFTPPAPAPQVQRMEETAAAITYTAGWNRGSRFTLRSGENAMQSSTTGARAALQFSGRSIRWIGQRGFSAGIARVFLDGTHVGDVDLYAPLQEEHQAVAFEAHGLPAGPHTIAIEVSGSKNPSSGGVEIVVDAFDVY